MSRTAEQRKQNTEYARRYRQRQIDALNLSRSKCGALLANRLRCNTPLQSRLVDGETIPFCPTCNMKKRGICIDCREKPVYGTPNRSLRCELCQKLAKQKQLSAYRKRHPQRLRKREEKRLRNPEKMRAKLEYKRLYRHSKPEKVRGYKRDDYVRNREKYLEYHRQYRAKKRAERAATELARYHGTLPPRTCVSCPTVLTGRPKKCEACRKEQKRQARLKILDRILSAAA